MENEEKPYGFELSDLVPMYGMIKRGNRTRKVEITDYIAVPFNFLITLCGIGAAGVLIVEGLEKFVY